AGFVAAGTVLHYLAQPFAVIAVVWFALAIWTGFVLTREFALSLALMPWLLARAAGAMTGRSVFPGNDVWLDVLVASVLPGLIGVTAGTLVSLAGRRQR